MRRELLSLFLFLFASEGHKHIMSIYLCLFPFEEESTEDFQIGNMLFSPTGTKFLPMVFGIEGNDTPRRHFVGNWRSVKTFVPFFHSPLLITINSTVCGDFYPSRNFLRK